MLETCVEMSFKTQLSNHGIVVAVDMCIDTIHALEDLSNHAWERFWERHT